MMVSFTSHSEPKGKLIVIGDSIDWGYVGGSMEPNVKPGEQDNWAYQYAKQLGLNLEMVAFPGATSEQVAKAQVPLVEDLFMAKANDLPWVISIGAGSKDMVELLREKPDKNPCINGVTAQCQHALNTTLASIEHNLDMALASIKKVADPSTTILLRTHPAVQTAPACQDVPIRTSGQLMKIAMHGGKPHNSNSTILGLNDRIRALAKKHQVKLVDLSKDFGPNLSDAQVGRDCVHLSNTGYKVIKTKFKKINR